MDSRRNRAGLLRGDPAWVSDGILQSIRTRVDQLNAMEECILSGLEAGDDITIHAGPFSGCCGIFSSYLSDRERVIVFLRFVRDQQIRFEQPVGQISLLEHARGTSPRYVRSPAWRSNRNRQRSYTWKFLGSP